MNFFCFSMLLVQLACSHAAMQISVLPDSTVEVHTAVTVTCSSDEYDANRIAVFFAGTKCFNGCDKTSRSKCVAIGDTCTIGSDNKSVTISFTALESLNNKGLRCIAGETVSSSVQFKIRVPPTIESSSIDVRVAEGDSTTLFCEIRSIDDVLVQWKRDDTSLSQSRISASANRFRTNASFTLQQVTVAEAGMYSCEVKLANDLEISGQSKLISVSVVRPPSAAVLTLESSSVTEIKNVDQSLVFSVDDSLSFSCEATSESDVNVQLFERGADGEKKPWHSCQNTICSGQFTVKSSDGPVTISCSAENEATVFQKRPVVSDDYVFWVARSPTTLVPAVVVDDSTALEADENMQHTVRCTSDSPAVPAVTIELFRDDQVFGSSSYCQFTQVTGGKVTSCSWLLQPGDFTRDYNKKYFCRSSYTTQSIDSTSIEVKFPPRSIGMYSRSQTGTYKEGDEVRLQCRTDSANPSRNILWTRNDAPHEAEESSNEPGEFDGVRTLSTISFTASRDDLRVTCSVEGTDIKDSFDFEVNYPPTVSVSMPPDRVYEGDEVLLECKAMGGKPDVSSADLQYMWERRMTNDENAPWKLMGTGDALRLEDVSRFHSALYRCTVSVPQSGQSSSAQDLLVLYKPVLDPPVQQDRVVLSSASCDEGDEELECAQIALRILCEPELVACKWTQNGTPLNTDSPSMITQSNNETHCVLNIKSQKGDTSVLGSYAVEAINEVGSNVFTVQVQAPSPPQKPKDVAVQKVTPRSCVVQWTSGFAGADKQTFQVSAIRVRSTPRKPEPSSVSITVDDTGFGNLVTAKVRPLDPGTEYLINVKAKNNNPTENESELAEINCTTLPKPVVSALLERGDVGTGDSVVIKFVGDQRPPSMLRMELRYCKNVECKSANVNGLTPVTLGVQLPFEELVKQYTFVLRLYDDEDLVTEATVTAASSASSKEKSKQAGMQTELLIGIAVGGIFIAILFITCTIFLLRRKHAPHEGAARGARRSSSDDDQNQVSKPLMKDNNGAMQPNSPRSWSDSAHRPPNSGANFKKSPDSPTNKNNNNNNHFNSRNTQSARAIDCEMADLDAKQALMKGEAEDAEEDLKKDFQNVAFESLEKHRDRQDDILKAVMDIGEEQADAEADLIASKNSKPILNEQIAQRKNVPTQRSVEHERADRVAPIVNDGRQKSRQQSYDSASPTQTYNEEGESGPKPPPRKPKRATSNDEQSSDVRYGNDGGKPVCVAMTKNGVQASVV